MSKLRLVGYAITLLAVLTAPSCGLGEQYMLTEEQLAKFDAAGPITPEVDESRLLAGSRPGPYRLVTGDLLEVTGPKTLFAGPDSSPNGAETFQHLARVATDGKIAVPILGEFNANGKTVLQLETALTEAAHPKFLKQKPSMVVRINEHRVQPVTVIGAVDKPGVVRLRSDQMTLYEALTAAGGIQRPASLVLGARAIKIVRVGESKDRSLILPVKGLSVPYADVALQAGDTIEVQRYEPDKFTVIGLVTKPGAYDYPPEVEYNLMQALAFAGGVDTTADPPYATVFRKDADGSILPATFEIQGVGLAKSSGLRIKPGDVIVVEHTAMSWTRSLLAEVLRINFGFFIDPRVGD